jgi:hypothetical protein
MFDALMSIDTSALSVEDHIALLNTILISGLFAWIKRQTAPPKKK